MEEKLQVIRNHKDTVFRMLYRDKKNLLELYNALNGTAYEDPDSLEVYTLENAIYMAFKNDVSFLLGPELNLYEHQASFNPNMPLRDLLYIARQLEKYVKDATLYSGVLTKIPVPRFVVFYNGTKEQPERQILKLSDAYERPVEEPELELKVLMLNINAGYNKEIMEKCHTLREYCLFVACIREQKKRTGDIREAVEAAVTECIDKGILTEFLRDQRAEVVAMSIFEYNEEEELKKIGSAHFNAGMEKGLEKGMEKGLTEGKAQSILTLLEEFGPVSESLQKRIMEEKDSEQLHRWLKAAAKAASIEDFQKEM